MKILSCGAGMQSTALALISCRQIHGETKYPHVPRYDAVIYCDLGIEPVWVIDQVKFIEHACLEAGIPFYILQSDLYRDYMDYFGKSRVSGMPFWTLDADGKPGRIGRRACTVDYKILMIQKFVRSYMLGYRPRQRLREEDIGAHELHIGFSLEEASRSFPSHHRMFENKFPLIDMGWERADTYRYNLEEWGLDSKASACLICPFHKNYFFQHIKHNFPADYANVVQFDDMLEQRQPLSKIKNRIFLSRSRKRIRDLTPADCNDAQTFEYRGRKLWNGF